MVEENKKINPMTYPFRVMLDRQVLSIIAMFSIALILSVLLAIPIYASVATTTTSTAPPFQSSAPFGAHPLYTLAFYVVDIIVFTVIILLLHKHRRRFNFFKVAEFLMVVFASAIFFDVILAIALSVSPIANNINGSELLILSFGLGFGLYILKRKVPSSMNMVAIIASVGVGLVLGLVFSIYWALAFFGVLAAYDFIAVFITKHMIKLADSAMQSNVAIFIRSSQVVPTPLNQVDAKTRKEFEKLKPELEQDSSIGIANAAKQNLVPRISSAALGTGDIIMPMMVAISSYNGGHVWLTATVIVGSIGGLYFAMWGVRRFKRAMPALPFLLAGILAALGVFVLISYL